jgi:hypothetical protein
MAYAVSRQFGWEYGLLMSSLTWFFFDGALNTYAFHRGWWYIGTTAFLDKIQQWIGATLHMEASLISAIIKNLYLALTITLVIIKSQPYLKMLS